MSEWQTIGNHPLNEVVDLWQVDKHGQGTRHTNMIFHTGYGFHKVENTYNFFRSDARWTHWMRPPAPPET